MTDPTPHPALTDPALADETAPDRFRVKLETTKGDIVIDVERDWAPLGADRFYNLVRIGYYDEITFFRVIDGFMAQFGISGDPRVSAAWRQARLEDDPVKQSNRRGTISFAMAGPHTRTTQLFINTSDRNVALDGQGFAPFGRVSEGMEAVDALHSGYGEGAPGGRGPSQGEIQRRGNAYLQESFPDLDSIKRASVI